MPVGDFNSKVRRRTRPESCIGQWSRDRRNQNSTRLVEFCEKNGKIIANRCFQHPAKYITTWLQRRTSPVTKHIVSIYNQIDYIILNQKNKQVLTDARSYEGTETSSDHRRVVARCRTDMGKNLSSKDAQDKSKDARHKTAYTK